MIKETNLEISDDANTQGFHEQWNLVNSRSDSSDLPRSVGPYASNYPLAKYRTQAVESLLPRGFTKRSDRKQEINELYDRGDGGG